MCLYFCGVYFLSLKAASVTRPSHCFSSCFARSPWRPWHRARFWTWILASIRVWQRGHASAGRVLGFMVQIKNQKKEVSYPEFTLHYSPPPDQEKKNLLAFGEDENGKFSTLMGSNRGMWFIISTE